MNLLILNGIVCDPANRTYKKADIFIENGKIVRISPKSEVPRSSRDKLRPKSKIQTIDANGKIVTPGLIDIHTHLREPGREDEETIKTLLKTEWWNWDDKKLRENIGQFRNTADFIKHL